MAGSLAAIGYAVNVRHVVKSPHAEKSLAPWIIWSLVGALLLKSYLTVGGSSGETSDSGWVLLVYALGPPIVLGTLVVYGGVRHASFSLLDKLFLAVSLASGVYLWRFDDGLVPLHVNAAVDVLGGVLLGFHVCRSPYSESLAAWSLFGAASALNLLAVQRWSYSHAVYPVVLAAMTTALAVVIAVRRRVSPGITSLR